MTEQSSDKVQLVLFDETLDSPIVVGREAYLQFDQRMAQQLQELVERWAHAAAPAAARVRRGNSAASGS